MVSNRTKNPSPPPSHTLPRYTFIWHIEGGGGELNQREGLSGNSSQIWFENTNMIWLYLQSINSDKHMPQSPFTGQFV